MVNHLFEELDYQVTPLGAISLRRRSEPKLNGKIVYEVKLGDEYLMSSLFVDAEIALAKLGLGVIDGNKIDVIVGGLGLGYTAAAVLDDQRVASLKVIDIMQPVIDWHQKELVPLGEKIHSDSRCQLIRGNFFDMATSGLGGFDSQHPNKRYHGILLDIDHSPEHWLNPGNESFYTMTGVAKMVEQLLPGGVFGLWSNDPPSKEFMELISPKFAEVSSHVIEFDNPYQGGVSANTVYLAVTSR